MKKTSHQNAIQSIRVEVERRYGTRRKFRIFDWEVIRKSHTGHYIESYAAALK